MHIIWSYNLCIYQDYYIVLTIIKKYIKKSDQLAKIVSNQEFSKSLPMSWGIKIFHTFPCSQRSYEMVYLFDWRRNFILCLIYCLFLPHQQGLEYANGIFCRRVRFPLLKRVLSMTLNFFWWQGSRSGECGVSLHCYYCQTQFQNRSTCWQGLGYADCISCWRITLHLTPNPPKIVFWVWL